MTWVLFPYKRGAEPAKIGVTASKVVVANGSETDSLVFDSSGAIVLSRNGKETLLSNE